MAACSAPLYPHICNENVNGTHSHPSALFSRTVTHIRTGEREKRKTTKKEKKHKMFFAHLQHLRQLDMPSVGCTVSAPSPPPPCTPPCIHSNTHTCTKYVSCCILATGKVITERAKELACCRAADLIRSHRETGRQIFPPCSPTQHLYINAVKCKFFFFLFFCLPSLRLLDSL